jgi:hypothetical protein
MPAGPIPATADFGPTLSPICNGPWNKRFAPPTASRPDARPRRRSATAETDVAASGIPLAPYPARRYK